jgi:hypothetical protein
MTDFYQISSPPSAQAYGFTFPWGTVLPPSTQVAAFVCSGGAPDLAPDWITNNLVETLNAGLARCKADRQDTVVVLPGHSESVTASAGLITNLVAGTRIIGIGRGSKMPTFRWTATAGNWPLSANDVEVRGLRLRLEGANGVTEAITVTGADNLISDCDIETASGASNKATLAINVSTGAARLQFIRNRVRGTATHNSTDILKIASALDQIQIIDNIMQASATAGNGLIHVTAAATALTIARNILRNSMTSSTACIALDNVASTGVCVGNVCSTLNDGTVTAQGIVFTSTGSLVQCFENYVCDEPRKSGTLTPAAGT